MKKTLIAISLFAFAACNNAPKEEKGTNTPTKEETSIKRAEEINNQLQFEYELSSIFKQTDNQDSLKICEERITKLEEELSKL